MSPEYAVYFHNVFFIYLYLNDKIVDISLLYSDVISKTGYTKHPKASTTIFSAVQ